MAGKNRPLMSELNWQNGFTPGVPVTAGFLRVGLLPQHQHIPALQPSTQCPMCAAGHTPTRELVLIDYAELELRAAASMTPEQIAAMRQENDDESNHT